MVYIYSVKFMDKVSLKNWYNVIQVFVTSIFICRQQEVIFISRVSLLRKSISKQPVISLGYL